MNMRKFVTPSREIFEDMQFLEIVVKLSGVPIDVRTIAFGLIMLQPLGYVRDVKLFSADVEGFCPKGFVTLDLLAPRLGREKAIIDDGREFWVYFQYEQVQAICYRCGLIGHVLGRCSHPHLPLDLEARNQWICVEASGEEIDDVFLLKKSEEKKWARKRQAMLPPAVLKAASNSMLWDRPPTSRNRRTGHVVGNRQSSLVARPGSISVQNKKIQSSTKSSASFCNRARNNSNVSSRAVRGNRPASSPPSKRRLTYQAKGKAKMSEKSPIPTNAFPMQNKGIVIREQPEIEMQGVARIHGVSRSLDELQTRPKVPKVPALSAPTLFGVEGSGVRTMELMPHQQSERSSASMKLVKKLAVSGEKETNKLAAVFSEKHPKNGLQSLVFGSFGVSCTKVVGEVQRALKGTNINHLTISEGSIEASDMGSSSGFHSEKLLGKDVGSNMEALSQERVLGNENDRAIEDFDQEMESGNEEGFGLINEKLGDNHDLEFTAFGMEGNPSSWTDGSDFAELDQPDNGNDPINLEVFEEGGTGKRRNSEVEEASLEWPQKDK
ncbi:hypothetical protein LINPERHAP1_LOCUS27295 [Linum perenne]